MGNSFWRTGWEVLSDRTVIHLRPFAIQGFSNGWVGSSIETKHQQTTMHISIYKQWSCTGGCAMTKKQTLGWFRFRLVGSTKQKVTSAANCEPKKSKKSQEVAMNSSYPGVAWLWLASGVTDPFSEEFTILPSVNCQSLKLIGNGRLVGHHVGFVQGLATNCWMLDELGCTMKNSNNWTLFIK